MIKCNRSHHGSSRFLRCLLLFVQPIGAFRSLWILDVPQYVLFRDGPCILASFVRVHHAHFCSGYIILRCLALGIAEIGRHSHDHLFVQPVDVLCHLWNHDGSQPGLSHDGPCILRCQALGIVEIGRQSHDRIVFLGQVRGVVVSLVGPPECCCRCCVDSESGCLRHCPL